MAPTIITSGSARSREPWWITAAVVLWLAVAILAALYFFDGDDAGASTNLEGGRNAGSDLAAATGPLGVSTTDRSLTTTTAAPTTTTAPPTTTTTEAPATTTTTMPPPLVVAASGDVLADRGPGHFMDKHGGEAIFTEVKPFLEAAQLAFVNVEGPMSTSGTRASWKEYTFLGRPAIIDGFVYAGIDMISLANNHSMDYGSKALLDTFVRLREAGVQWAGAGTNAKEAAAPAMLITPAGTVAFLAYTDIIPGGFTAGSDSPGVNATTPDRKKILSAVEAADKKADYVIVSFHWGVEYTGVANQTQRTLAHQVIDAGADLVLGHHPHVLQGLEIYKDKLIAYSLGDFVWDHYSVATGETIILTVTIQPAGPPSLEAVPIYLDDVNGAPAPVTGEHAASILGRLARFSADLGLELTISDDRATYVPSRSAASEMGTGAAPPTTP